MTSLLQHSQSRTAHAMTCRNSKPLAPVTLWPTMLFDLSLQPTLWGENTSHYITEPRLPSKDLLWGTTHCRIVLSGWVGHHQIVSPKYIFPKNVVFESNYSHESDKKLCHVPRLINMRALGICFSSSWLIDRRTGHRPRFTLSESALVFVSLMLFRCWF